MMDRIVVNTGRMGEWARELNTVQNELKSIAGRLSRIDLSDEAGGDLHRSGSYSLRAADRRFSGSNARQCAEALSAATEALAESIGGTSSGIQQAMRLFEEKEKWINAMIDGLLGGTGEEEGTSKPSVVTPANLKWPPTLDFENYNNVWDWLWRQSEVSQREAIIKLSDPFSELDTISIIKNGLIQGYKIAEEGITTLLDDEGVSNGDRRAMANVMINQWAEQIKSGQIQVEGYESLARVVGMTEEVWEAMSIEERSRQLSNVLNTIGLASEEAGIAAIIVEGSSEAAVANMKRIAELAQAKLVVQALRSESISVAGMDPQLYKQIKDTLDSSGSYIDAACDVLVNTKSAGDEMVKDWAIGELLERATFKGTDVVDVAAGWALGEKASDYEALNSSVSILEGAVDVFTKDTRPQLERAMENYRNSPTAENYQQLKEKAETYADQAKAVSKQYYDVLEKTSGKNSQAQYEKAVQQIGEFANQFQ